MNGSRTLFMYSTVIVLRFFACLHIVQDPFPSVSEPRVHRPMVGTSLTMNCVPPYGYPKGMVYWGEYKAGDTAGSKLKPIKNSERVSLDYAGIYELPVLPVLY